MKGPRTPLVELSAKFEQRRLRVLSARRAVHGALVGLISALPFALLGQLGVALPSYLIPAVVLGVPALAFLSAFLRRRTVAQVLADVDRREGLKQRLVTAYEIAQHGTETRFARLAVDDAVERLSLLPPEWVYPRRFPAAAWALPPLVGLVVVLAALNLGLPQLGAPSRALQNAGAVLEESAQRLAARAQTEPLPDSRQLALEMERLGRELRTGNPPPDAASQAQALSSQLQAQVQGLQRQLLSDLAQREQAGGGGSGAGGGGGRGAGGAGTPQIGGSETQNLSETLSQMLQKQLSPEELNRLRQALSNDSSLSPDQQSQIGRDFERNRAAGGGYDQPNLANDLLRSLAPDGASKQALSDLQSAQGALDGAQRSLSDQGAAQSGKGKEQGSTTRQLDSNGSAQKSGSQSGESGSSGSRNNRLDHNFENGLGGQSPPGEAQRSATAPEQGSGPSNLPGNAPDTHPNTTAQAVAQPEGGVPLHLTGSDSGGASIESLIRDLPAARESTPDVSQAAHNYEKQMEAVIASDTVPPTERKFVRDYFTSIQGEH